MTLAGTASTTSAVHLRRWLLAAAVAPGAALALLVDLRPAPLALGLAVVVALLQQGLP
jgi:hypothetical protein